MSLPKRALQRSSVMSIAQISWLGLVITDLPKVSQQLSGGVPGVGVLTITLRQFLHLAAFPFLSFREDR